MKRNEKLRIGDQVFRWPQSMSWGPTCGCCFSYYLSSPKHVCIASEGLQRQYAFLPTSSHKVI